MLILQQKVTGDMQAVGIFEGNYGTNFLECAEAFGVDALIHSNFNHLGDARLGGAICELVDLRLLLLYLLLQLADQLHKIGVVICLCAHGHEQCGECCDSDVFHGVNRPDVT